MSSHSNDRPLSGTANFLLLIGAAANILLFYLFVFGSILVLLVVLAVEICFGLALARFGLFRLVTPAFKSHGTLLSIFVRSLWLGKSVEFRIPITRDDAPELYTVLKKICPQAKVPLPHKVFLQMGVNAWVNMQGFRRGAGKTILGIGYDLLAGLSLAEMEGVLAHEMMHAKLVQRGFRQLLAGGISRAARLTNGLFSQVTTANRVGKDEAFAKFFLQIADTLTRTSSRQMAACSRQDEFAADRGAAGICGAGAIRSSLLKLDGLNRIAARLPLRDRIAQLESGEGFGHWLVKELAAASFDSPVEAKVQAFNKYSTHPSLYDRLAALADFPDQTLADSPSAIVLLAHPDRVAEKLVAAIQKQIIAQEQKDSKTLDRWSRKFGASRNMQPLHAIGVLGLIIALFFTVFGLVLVGPSLGLVIFSVVTIGGSVALICTGSYREKFVFPVPDYPLIKTTSLQKRQITDEQVKGIENEFRQMITGVQKTNQKAATYLNQSREALVKCDYLRAHIAARFCLEQEKKSIPGHMALAIAAGGLNMGKQVGQAINFVQQKVGVQGGSLSWAAGWALLLAGDWVHAEAFLEQARARKPESATILALLAVSQARRGKLFSAIASSRKASLAHPNELEYSKLLIDLLLQGGFLREASEKLQQVVHEAVSDIDLSVAMVKVSLLLRNESIADQWMDLIKQSNPGPEKYVTVAQAYEAARLDDKAVSYYQHALVSGYYPEALLGLGRLAAIRQDKTLATAHLLAALNLQRPLGENSVGPIPLVLAILQQLKQMEEPILNCRAWIGSFPGNIQPTAVAGKSFFVYALNNEGAKKYLDTMLNAMQPGTLTPVAFWRLASKQQQPDGPVQPGIHAVF
jgi:Zn-dependent protease with chaperone function/tetratricopeptide (TPR) repeat protein